MWQYCDKCNKISWQTHRQKEKKSTLTTLFYICIFCFASINIIFMSVSDIPILNILSSSVVSFYNNSDSFYIKTFIISSGMIIVISLLLCIIKSLTLFIKYTKLCTCLQMIRKTEKCTL